MHAISTYHGNRPTHTQMHTLTHRQDWLQCTAPQLVRNVMRSISVPFKTAFLYAWSIQSEGYHDQQTLLLCQKVPPSIWLHLFCGAGHEKRRESSWSGPWHLCCTLEVFHVHSYQDRFIQPVLAECFCVCIFSLGLCFACWFVLFDLFVSPFFCVSSGSWVISLTLFGASVTNLNEPPRALATSTIMWVRS